jgi:uncharacterized protein YcfJ
MGNKQRNWKGYMEYSITGGALGALTGGVGKPVAQRVGQGLRSKAVAGAGKVRRLHRHARVARGIHKLKLKHRH